MKRSGYSKTMNEYAECLGPLYTQAPKAVHAAVAVSVLTMGGNVLDEARDRFRAEWRTLWENGIIPQAPPKARPGTPS